MTKNERISGAHGDPSVSSRFIFTVGHNTPGYLPEGDVWSFDTFEDARLSLRDDLTHASDATWDLDDLTGDQADEGVALDHAIRELDDATGPDFLANAAGSAWWIECQEVTESEYREIMDAQQ